MTSQLLIRVNDTHILDSPDGKTLRLRAIDGRPTPPGIYHTGSDEPLIPEVEHLDVALALYDVQPVKEPDLKTARAFVRQCLSTLHALTDARPSDVHIATFGLGHFKLRWNPQTEAALGYWSFATPQDPRREPEDREYVVSTVYDLDAAVWHAVQRTLFVSGCDIRYEDLGSVLLMLAELLLSDPYLTTVSTH